MLMAHKMDILLRVLVIEGSWMLLVSCRNDFFAHEALTMVKMRFTPPSIE